MPTKQHHYELTIDWTGNRGEGTKTYTSYTRNHTISAKAKPQILGSSDPAFRGDPTRYNPEDLFLSSVSTCHMLWYLHLCAVNHVVVLEYTDAPVGIVMEKTDGSGKFEGVTLRPRVRLTPESDPSKALALHEEVHRYCFIANSVNFKIVVEPQIT
jgi:organic hydroperoxide reductase OsmC/OhrA